MIPVDLSRIDAKFENQLFLLKFSCADHSEADLSFECANGQMIVDCDANDCVRAVSFLRAENSFFFDSISSFSMILKPKKSKIVQQNDEFVDEREKVDRKERVDASSLIVDDVDDDSSPIRFLTPRVKRLFTRLPLSREALVLLPRSTRYRHSMVRHLAWIAESSALADESKRCIDMIAAVEHDELLPFLESTWLRVRMNEARLREFDEDPTPILEFFGDKIRVKKLNAVGSYFTRLMRLFLTQCMKTPVSNCVAKSQIFSHDKRRTLGDIDLFFEAESERHHVELAIKNYVQVDAAEYNDANVDSSDPMYALAQFVGPLATGDSLCRILRFTKDRQKRLSQLAECEAIVEKMSSVCSQESRAQAPRVRFCLRGNLFRNRAWPTTADEMAINSLPHPVEHWSLRIGATEQALTAQLRLLMSNGAIETFLLTCSNNELTAIAFPYGDNACENLQTVEEWVDTHRDIFIARRGVCVAQIAHAKNLKTYIEVRRFYFLPNSWNGRDGSKDWKGRKKFEKSSE